MSLWDLLLWPMRYGLDNLMAQSQGEVTHPVHEAPSRRRPHIRPRRLAGDVTSSKHPGSVTSPPVFVAETFGTVHAQPRSLSNTQSSSFLHSLPFGILIGVLGTLLIQGFIFASYRVHCRTQELKFRRRKPSRPIGSHHVNLPVVAASGFEATASAGNSTASLLRVAHRQPDGSWYFTDAPGANAQQRVPIDAPLTPPKALVTPPWSPNTSTSSQTHSPTTSTRSPTTSTRSPTTSNRSPTSRPLPTPPWTSEPNVASTASLSTQAGPMELDCGSSARTGPPPYASTPLPVPLLPQGYARIKGRHQMQ